MRAALAPDLKIQPFGQSIDYGHPHSMQAAGDLVGVLVEFAARMQLRHDHLGGRDTFFGMDRNRDTAAVVLHGYRTIGVERHSDAVTVAGQGFIDGIVHHLENHVMEAGAVIGIADIHPRPLAHGIESLQDLDGFGIIGLGMRIACADLFVFLRHIPTCIDSRGRRLPITHLKTRIRVKDGTKTRVVHDAGVLFSI